MTSEPLQTVQERLAQLEELYVNEKAVEKANKKAIKKYGDEIKTLMLASGMEKFNTLNVKSTPKQTFNEFQAIEILRNNLDEELFNNVVKTKEYIDDDALEKLIYNHQLDEKLLTPCIGEEKPVITLRIGKKEV